MITINTSGWIFRFTPKKRAANASGILLDFEGGWGDILKIRFWKN